VLKNFYGRKFTFRLEQIKLYVVNLPALFGKLDLFTIVNNFHCAL
jgi:hypothetical protein